MATTIQDVMHWIVDNCDDVKSMDKISKATFPFTRKYIDYYNADSNIELSTDNEKINIKPLFN